ncbi:hypothetical protein D9M72_626910 [compost metagenome]
MMRCSVAENSRPSTRICCVPVPPNSVSITPKTSVGSQISRPEPRSGRTCTMLMLVGTTTLRRKAPNFCTFTGPTAISGLRRMKLKMPMRKLRAKRSFTISSVGMRPRTIRSWLERS